MKDFGAAHQAWHLQFLPAAQVRHLPDLLHSHSLDRKLNPEPNTTKIAARRRCWLGGMPVAEWMASDVSAQKPIHFYLRVPGARKLALARGRLALRVTSSRGPGPGSAFGFKMRDLL